MMLLIVLLIVKKKLLRCSRHVVLTATPWGRYSYPYFTDEEPEIKIGLSDLLKATQLIIGRPGTQVPRCLWNMKLLNYPLQLLNLDRQ